MQREVVTIEGRQVRAYHQPGDGPAVVLIHGAGGSGASWEPVADAWRWADVWCPSLPGRDGSDSVGHASVAEVATWLRAWLEAAELSQRPWLVGHSFGGGVALDVALRAPDAIAGLVMVSSGAKLRVSPAILEGVAAGTVDPSLPVDTAFGPDTEPAVIARYRADTASIPRDSALGDWRACDGFDVLAELADLRSPLAVIYGSDDVLTPPRHQRRLAEAVEGAHAVELSGRGHMLPWEAPAAVADAVRVWLDRAT